MPRYIDADLIEPSEIIIPCGDGTYEYVEVVYMDDIREIPTADVVDKERYDRLLENANILADAVRKYQTADVPERNVGKWIEYNYPGAECVYCSKCKEEYYPDDLLLGGNDYPNFCPNCGASMQMETKDVEKAD